MDLGKAKSSSSHPDNSTESKTAQPANRRTNIRYVPIAELKNGSRVEACYLIENATIRNRKDGGQYLTLVLRDATGKANGIAWDNFEGFTNGAIREKDFGIVSAEVSQYNGQLQLKVSKIERVADEAVDGTYFLPRTAVPQAVLDQRLDDYLNSVSDSDYRALLDMILGQPEVRKRFRLAPSAVAMHQAYLGGLMEHTLNVVDNAVAIARNYPTANRDLIVTAGLLHDIGKITELSYEKKIAYTDVGRLLGHISIGFGLVERYATRIPDFPLEKKILLQHLIISHHGVQEYGSPECPKTLEAVILHHADVTDAQISNYLEFVASSRNTGTRWEYSKMFERFMFAGGPLDGLDVTERIMQGADETAAASRGEAEDFFSAIEDTSGSE
jgi:3'-5' exoribonuclease